MKKLRFFFCTAGLLLGAALLLFYATPAARAQGTAPARVRIAPQAQSVLAGETILVLVTIEDVQDLYGFEIRLTFDPALLEVVDTRPQEQGVQVELGDFLEPGFTLRNQADNAAGTLHYVMTQLNPTPARSGSGVLLEINFRALAPNSAAQIAFADVKLAAPGGVKIEGVGVDGSIQITPSSQPVPPPTATPTLGPGETFVTPTLPAVTPPPATATPLPTNTPVATNTPLPTNTPAGAGISSTAADSDLDAPLAPRVDLSANPADPSGSAEQADLPDTPVPTEPAAEMAAAAPPTSDAPPPAENPASQVGPTPTSTLMPASQASSQDPGGQNSINILWFLGGLMVIAYGAGFIWFWIMRKTNA